MKNAIETISGRVRVFFALWPDADLRCMLDQLGAQLHALCGGRRTRAETIHMTLAFLGNIEETRLTDLQTLATQLESEAFDMMLQRPGWWQRNNIAWVAPVSTPPALTHLVNKLQSRLLTTGFNIDKRAYFPHVTLVRNAACTVSSGKIATVNNPLKNVANTTKINRKETENQNLQVENESSEWAFNENLASAIVFQQPVEWLVRDFVLVKSVRVEDGSIYEVIGRWPLLTTPSLRTTNSFPQNHDDLTE